MDDTETVWVDREFDDHDFRDDDLRGLRTERVVFTDCDFSGVDLGESEHVGSAFRNCTFHRTSLWHSTFRHCSMLGSVFTECRLRPLTLVEVDFTLAILGGCDLRGARSDPTLWTTAAVRGARIDIEQALAFAAAHGLDVHGE
ncbi:MAG: pentapeptide repeat-containing protein [Mycobacterium sp.]